MKWFRHDATALNDAKICAMVDEFGLESYGLYFAIVEIIASEIELDHLTFELEHTEKSLARKLNITPERLTILLEYMVKVGLFGRSENGKINCFRLAQRLDNTTTQNPEFKKLISNLSNSKSNLNSENRNLNLLFTDKIRSNKIRDKDISDQPEGKSPCPVQEIVKLYHSLCPALPQVRILSENRKRKLQARWKSDTKHQTMKFWENYFKYVSESKFLTGSNERNWTADFEWLVHEPNFIKVIEGKYHGQR